MLQLSTGKPLNSMGMLTQAQERAYRRKRRKGFDITRAEWIASMVMTDREKRCLTKAWYRRKARVNKRFADRARYLSRRATEMRRRVDSAESSIPRLRGAMQGNISKLLYRDADDHDADVVGPADTAPGSAETSGNEVSDAQCARLFRQAVSTAEVLGQQHDRDAFQIFHFEDALTLCRSREADAATVRSAKRHPHEAIIMHHLNEAELIRLRNSLVHIAEDVVGNKNSQCKPKSYSIMGS